MCSVEMSGLVCGNNTGFGALSGERSRGETCCVQTQKSVVGDEGASIPSVPDL